MFYLKTPCAIVSTSQARGDAMEVKGEYGTLEEAIEASIKSDLNLETAMIERNGGRHSVNDWISFRIAGGQYALG